jgi:hypothetical protein
MMNAQESAPVVSTENYKGIILEGAFVDPAYSWPPKEGEGHHAVELEASTMLLTKSENPQDADELKYPEPPKIKTKRVVVTEKETYTVARCGFFKCCRSDEHVVNRYSKSIPVDPNQKEELKKDYYSRRNKVRELRKKKRSQLQNEQKYTRVPDGVLIYRLDTSTGSVTLISVPNSNTEIQTLMTDIVVVDAYPSKSLSRRGIILTDKSGDKYELVACEQRTATSWMEALNMMLGKGKGIGKVSIIHIRSIGRKRNEFHG